MDPLVSVVIVLSILLALSFGGNILVLKDGTGAASNFGNFFGSLLPQSLTGNLSSEGRSQTSEMFFEFMGLLISFSPNVFFAFGFLLDIFNSTYHYSIPSITAFCAMILNSMSGPVVDVVGYYSGKLYDNIASQHFGKELPIRPPPGVFSSKPVDRQKSVELKPFRSILDDDVGPTTDTRAAEAVLERNIRERQREQLQTSKKKKVKQAGGSTSSVNTCSLPGFVWLENDIAPQGIVMSMTILSYLLYELWDHGLFEQSIGLSVTTGVVFVLQSINLIGSGCLQNYRYKNWSILIALAIAVASGTSSYAIQKRIWGGVVMPSTNSKQTVGTTSAKSAFETIINVGEKTSQSEPVNDQDQFVCEAYKDGELITSTIVD
jgi:hypothetical protein